MNLIPFPRVFNNPWVRGFLPAQDRPLHAARTLRMARAATRKKWMRSCQPGPSFWKWASTALSRNVRGARSVSTAYPFSAASDSATRRSTIRRESSPSA